MLIKVLRSDAINKRIYKFANKKEKQYILQQYYLY